MKYHNRDDTIQAEYAPVPRDMEESKLPGEVIPEFRVRASRAANGWWTREELQRLRDKLTGVLEQL